MKCRIYTFLVLLCCFYISSAQKNNKTNYSILFIGNSITYTNNLPKLVKKLAKKHQLNLKIRAITKPNYAIVDHLEEGTIQKELESKKYDFIIAQQGPSSQPEGRKLLIESGKEINNLIKSSNTKLVYFMVWPSLKYYQTFNEVIKNHRDAADLNNALLCPVGEVWKNHFDTTNNFDYYSPDDFHPSKKGSEFTAEIIVRTLFRL